MTRIRDEYGFWVVRIKTEVICLCAGTAQHSTGRIACQYLVQTSAFNIQIYFTQPSLHASLVVQYQRRSKWFLVQRCLMKRVWMDKMTKVLILKTEFAEKDQPFPTFILRTSHFFYQEKFFIPKFLTSL